MSGIVSLLAGPATAAAERGWVPDPLVRGGIRALCGAMRDASVPPAGIDAFAAAMRAEPIALVPELANAQHYEVPPGFFRAVLGPRMKYSSGYWADGVDDLAGAEESALEITMARARIDDDLDVLELGCGWGSLTLSMAERFPRARITAVTNSGAQAAFVRGLASDRGLPNVSVVRADMNGFASEGRFDRVVSIEMFEHMRNWEALLARIAGWLRPGGSLFVHVFRHRTHAYRYADDDPADWMGRHFFSGGIMPSRDLLGRFDRDLQVRETWDWDGTHYARTAEAWLARLDASRAQVLPELAPGGDRGAAVLTFRRWRLFFLACAELFAYADGSEWGVSHYRLEHRTGEGGAGASSS